MVMSADERQMVHDIAAMQSTLIAVQASIASMQVSIEKLTDQRNERPSLTAWIGAMVSLVMLIATPVGAIYWKFSDAISDLQNQRAADQMRIEQLEKQR